MDSNSEIKFEELKIKDTKILNEGLEMMNRTQGVGLFNMKYLTSKIESRDSLVLGAFLGGELIGIGCAEVIADFSYYVPFEPEIEERLSRQRVGSLCTLCIREDLQGRGIGQLISQRRIEWLEKKSCNLILGVAWLSGLRHTSDRVFKKIGFKCIGEVEEFFRQDAIKFPFNCPGCKIQPCLCSAALYEYSF